MPEHPGYNPESQQEQKRSVNEFLTNIKLNLEGEAPQEKTRIATTAHDIINKLRADILQDLTLTSAQEISLNFEIDRASKNFAYINIADGGSNKLDLNAPNIEEGLQIRAQVARNNVMLDNYCNGLAAKINSWAK